MTQESPEPPSHNDPKRLKDELKGLPKINAPWYFESDLQRRLHNLKRDAERKSWLAKPIPGYALSILGVLALAAVGYYVVFIPGVQEQPVALTPVGPRNDAGTTAMQAPPVAKEEPPSPDRKPSGEVTGGPAPPAEEALHRRLPPEPTVTSTEESLTVGAKPALGLDAPGDSATVSRSLQALPPVPETLGRTDTAKERRDSLRTKRDSLGTLRDTATIPLRK